MSNKRLIDGTALIEWLEQEPSQYKILPAIKSGSFDIPNQEEAATKRIEILENYLEELREVTPYGIYQEQITNVLNESRSISSHTEDTPEEPTRCGDCAHFSTPPYCEVFRQETEITAISCDSFVPDESEDTGIQKVREDESDEE